MTTFTPYSAAVGGVLIGLAATMLWQLNGRIAGISGIASAALQRRCPDRLWRLAFLGGMIGAGTAWLWFANIPWQPRENFPGPLLVIAGLLVGIGTRLGSGCTSGHGVCGVARFSPRSIVATLVFLMIGMTTATMLNLVGGLG